MAPRFMKALSTRGKQKSSSSHKNKKQTTALSSRHINASSLVAATATTTKHDYSKKKKTSSPELDASFNTLSTAPTVADDSRCCDDEVENMTSASTTPNSSPSSTSSKSFSSLSPSSSLVSSLGNPTSPPRSSYGDNVRREAGDESDEENQHASANITTRKKKPNYYDEVLPDLLPKETLQVGHIAKAAHALDTAGDECFEQGNYELAMTSYTRALELKRRALFTLKEDSPNRSSTTTQQATTTHSNNKKKASPNNSKDKKTSGSPSPPPTTTTTTPTTTPTPTPTPKKNSPTPTKPKNKRTSFFQLKKSPSTKQQQKEQQKEQPSVILETDASTTSTTTTNATTTTKGKKAPLRSPSSKKVVKAGTEKGAKEVVLASVATSMNNIGYLRQRTGGSSEEIMTAYRNALSIKKQILGPQNLSVGKTLNNIGSVYFSKQDLEKAMEAYQEALGIFYRHLGQQHLDVATVHSNIGDVYLAQGNNGQALVKYREALNIRWSQLGRHDRRVERLLEKVAALEMDRMIENLEQEEGTNHQNHPTHLSPQDLEYHSDDDIPDIQPPPMTNSLQLLRDEVKNDMEYIENIKRQVVVDMVKEKLQILREMKAITNDDSDSTDKREHSNADEYDGETSKQPIAPQDIRVEMRRTVSDPTNDHSPQDEDSGLKEPKMIPFPSCSTTIDTKSCMRSQSVNMMTTTATASPANTTVTSTPPRSSITSSSWTAYSPESSLDPSNSAISVSSLPDSYSNALFDVKDRLKRIRARRAGEHAKLTQDIQRLQVVLAIGNQA